MSKEKIVVIYEGNKTEKQIFKNIENNFFKDSSEIRLISFPAGENIYMLYMQVYRDDFQTDLIELLREYNDSAAKELEGIERKNISQIFLFFDYDGHSCNLGENINKSTDDVLKCMLEVFNNETELGKLYINYPMVESIRDNKKSDFCFRRCYISISEIGSYKNTVSDIKDYQDFRKIDFQDWKLLFKRSLCKVNCIVFDVYCIPKFNEYRKNITQLYIFEKQLEKYINPSKKISILNSFPLFLLDYFGYDFWQEMVGKY